MCGVDGRRCHKCSPEAEAVGGRVCGVRVVAAGVGSGWWVTAGMGDGLHVGGRQEAWANMVRSQSQ